jgi:hypothetical protein
MLGLIMRILFGFAIASIAAGLTLVLFVTTPAEIATATGDTDTFGPTALLALAVATHSAVFAAPFALLSVAIAERRSIKSWIYYALAGVVIAGIGFLAQYSSEAEGPATIFNAYALVAFLTTGLIAGIVFWLFCGRFAGSAGGQKGTTLAQGEAGVSWQSSAPPSQQTPSQA